MAGERGLLYMQYIGTLALLGRLARNLNPEDQYSVDRCFEDANKLLKEYEAGVFFARTAQGGWGSFMHEQEKK